MLNIRQYILRNLSLSKIRQSASIHGRFMSNSGAESNAGLIIIGDEILKAQIRDTNSFFMCSLLWECGVKVGKISVIGDDVDIIAKEIREFSTKYRYVITSGGVGPTHDDVTFEGLAKAFNDSLHCHPTLVDIVSSIFKTQDGNSPAYKIAHIPKKAVLRFGKHAETGELLKFPCINVENVFVFPGSPIYLEPLFQSLHKELFEGERQFAKTELYLDAAEELFADELTKVAKEFPNVAFGSYPIYNNNYYKARVTIESENVDETLRAQEKFSSLVSRDIIIKYDEHPHVDSHEKFSVFMESNPCEMMRKTLEELRKFYEKPNEVAISFDGSIESSVLLHLAHIAQLESQNDSKINLIMFKYEEWFSEVDAFIKEITSSYNLNVITLNMPPQEGIKRLEGLHPEIKILLLGIKSTNKDSGLYHSLARSLDTLPMVIKCPLNGWTVNKLWTFARSLSMPYCSLYDKGYTSIGGRETTKPNVDSTTGDEEIYQPAWKLNNVKK